MIISRTPFRVSFFGGGTDYPAWFRARRGAVLGTTINKYCYISCRRLPPFFAHTSRIVWSKIELVNDADEIQHPSVRATFKHLGVTQGVELHHDGDLPARTGLGSSSAFTVGLLHALYGLKGQMPTKSQLAREAIHVEQELLHEHVGCQDQILAAHGGLNRIEFHGDGSFEVVPVILPPQRLAQLQDHLLLFYTGTSRTASEIAAEQIRATPAKTAELTAMLELVDRAIGVLQGPDDIAEFGRLLHESWRLKRSLTDKISTAQIDDLYSAACRAGAVGGKLLGAGGGGFLLLCVRPEQQARVREALDGLLCVPFHFEQSGSRIIFYEPDDAGVPAPSPAMALAG